MAKILVIGGGGFIGANLCEALIHANHQVRVFERQNIKPLVTPQIFDELEWTEGDLVNGSDLEHVLQGQEIIIHLAATTLPKTSNDNPIYDVESNLVSAIRLLELSRQHGIRRIVFISSGGTVYGKPQTIPISETHATNPLNSYGITKLTIEKYLSLFSYLYGLRTIVLRLSNPFGPLQRTVNTQGAVAVFFGHALRGEPIEVWGDGSVIRDYIYISDVIRALIIALTYEGKESVFNLGSGVGVSISELVSAISKVIGREIEVKYTASRVLDVPTNVLDISRIQHEFCWKPEISLMAGLHLTKGHLVSHGY